MFSRKKKSITSIDPRLSVILQLLKNKSSKFEENFELNDKCLIICPGLQNDFLGRFTTPDGKNMYSSTYMALNEDQEEIRLSSKYPGYTHLNAMIECMKSFLHLAISFSRVEIIFLLYILGDKVFSDGRDPFSLINTHGVELLSEIKNLIDSYTFNNNNGIHIAYTLVENSGILSPLSRPILSNYDIPNKDVTEERLQNFTKELYNETSHVFSETSMYNDFVTSSDRSDLLKNAKKKCYNMVDGMSKLSKSSCQSPPIEVYLNGKDTVILFGLFTVKQFIETVSNLLKRGDSIKKILIIIDLINFIGSASNSESSIIGTEDKWNELFDNFDKIRKGKVKLILSNCVYIEGNTKNNCFSFYENGKETFEQIDTSELKMMRNHDHNSNIFDINFIR